MLLLLACRTVPVAGPAAVEVGEVRLSFSADGKGELKVRLVVRGPGTADRVRWDLVVDGQRLGAGLLLLGTSLALPVEWTVPLPVPGLGRDEGWREVTVELSGELQVTGGEARRPFFTRRELLVKNAPRP